MTRAVYGGGAFKYPNVQPNTQTSGQIPKIPCCIPANQKSSSPCYPAALCSQLSERCGAVIDNGKNSQEPADIEYVLDLRL